MRRKKIDEASCLGCQARCLTYFRVNDVKKAEKKKIKIAISNSFAFGGNNACLVFKKWG